MSTRHSARAAFLLSALTICALLACSDDATSPGPNQTQTQAILRVDYDDFLDTDPATNLIIFTGVAGALPLTTVTSAGNFPELDLRGFFASDQVASGEISATTEELTDFLGHRYGRLFRSGHFATPPQAEIPPTSIGLLATNRQNHDFDMHQTALLGRSVFDLVGMGLSGADFGTGGDVFAQDFPFVKIGRWEVAPPPAVILQVDYSDFLDTDPGSNLLVFTGVNGALPRVTVTSAGNFPELDLRGFFVSDQVASGEISATSEGLTDFLGHRYGRLFRSGHFATPPQAEIPPTSIGLLATNRQNHDFDMHQTALLGRSVFDLVGMGLSGADFGTGGDVFAQDFPFVKIGRWVALPAASVIAQTD